MQTHGQDSAAWREPPSALDSRRDLILFIRELVMRRVYKVPVEDVAAHIMHEALAILPDARKQR